MRREELEEQTGYHGYASNGRGIPKRAGRQGGSVAPAPAARSSYQEKWPRQPEEYFVDDASDEEDEYDTEWPPRLPTSSRRYMPEGSYTQGNTRFHVKYAAPPQRTAPQQPAPLKRHPVATDEVAIRKRRQKEGMHWMVFMGVGMLVMLALWVAGSMVLSAWTTWQDDIHYGRPRTFQCDAVVGHSDSPQNPSHFIALNLHAHIEIIELPGGDGTHARMYMGPTLYGYNVDLVPVTLSFKDVTGNGRPDMLIHFQDQTVVFINDGSQFRSQKPGEHISL